MPRATLPPPETAIVSRPEPGYVAQDWHDFFRRLARLSVTTAAYGSTINVDSATAGDFIVAITDGNNFAIAAPSNPVAGAVINYTFRNTSGGAIGTVTWNSVFKLAALTWPASGFSRSIQFVFDGSNWIQRYSSEFDVPN